MKKIAFIMCFSIFSIFSCSGQADLSVDAFDKMLGDDGVQLVDVRTADEFSAGHIAGAVNIDWFSKGFLHDAEATLDKSRPVMVYCRSGKRSAAAASRLQGAGFKTYNLKGGYIDWTAAGKPVTK